MVFQLGFFLVCVYIYIYIYNKVPSWWVDQPIQSNQIQNLWVYDFVCVELGWVEIF